MYSCMYRAAQSEVQQAEEDKRALTQQRADISAEVKHMGEQARNQRVRLESLQLSLRCLEAESGSVGEQR